MTEIILEGGELNVIVRVGDTVRRPRGAWSPAVHALLRHFERVGFDGAPRFLGIDEKGREILSYVEGEAGLAPVPASDDAVVALGALIRRMHDAQAGFVPPADAAWQIQIGTPNGGARVCHHDLFWPNVILREGLPVALIDWDLAAPSPPLYDVGSAALFWVPLRPDDEAELWGLPTDRRAERLRLLCDGYGLTRAQRAEVVEATIAQSQIGIDTYKIWGGELQLPGWHDLYLNDGVNRLMKTHTWLLDHAREIGRALA